MTFTDISSGQLRSLVKLVKEREKLQVKLAKINEVIAHLDGTVSSQPRTTKTHTPSSPKRKQGSTGNGSGSTEISTKNGFADETGLNRFLPACTLPDAV